ncbi:carboxylesterase [Holotrichia oblita]|uniref:Carboxylesterase n=1 Tax=Holotrichia oblita TaxID=644536 RepID=A0ACB9SV13_HOLOL|nr:carboxylesterase [Holotrichia oblita]
MPWTKPVVVGDEDCLYINVYVPREKPSPSDNFNVIAHFHGGAFMLGHGHMYAGPEYLMDEDVILVTMNYRVGAFGFLSTEDDVVPGNNGMKDQVMSLKWIQNNIRYFGGNPNSVTITGMSAGGASVHLHYFSPLSKGLFHRGFSESGTALDPWVLQEQGLEKAKRLAMLVGCPTDTSKEIIDCLRSRSGNKIVEQMKEFIAVMGCPLSPFAPVIEKEEEGAFLTEHPYKMLIDKTVTDVPWIVTIAEQEGYTLGLSFTKIFGEDLEKFDEAVPYLLDYNYTIAEVEKAEVNKKIKETYFKDGISFETLGKLFGDRLFIASADTSAKLQANANKSPVYFYILGYKGQHSIVDLFGINAEKIGEEDCLYFNVYVPKEKPSANDNLNGIVHIHGGAFMLGSGHFYAGPSYLMNEEVILVTINYRLGPFGMNLHHSLLSNEHCTLLFYCKGFLSTEDEVQPGNNGLRDQVQALKWIQKNIKYIGGIPSSVTLTELSAGGASVHYQYFSSLSKGILKI